MVDRSSEISFFMLWNARFLKTEERTSWSAVQLTDFVFYTDRQNQIPHCLWTTKLSLSCRHPTHLSTLFEVTFSSYCLVTWLGRMNHRTRKTELDVVWIFSELKGLSAYNWKPQTDRPDLKRTAATTRMKRHLCVKHTGLLGAVCSSFATNKA